MLSRIEHFTEEVMIWTIEAMPEFQTSIEDAQLLLYMMLLFCQLNTILSFLASILQFCGFQLIYHDILSQIWFLLLRNIA